MAERVAAHAWDGTAGAIADAIRRVLVERPIDQAAVARTIAPVAASVTPSKVAAAAGSR
jgi:hypothetical protein